MTVVSGESDDDVDDIESVDDVISESSWVEDLVCLPESRSIIQHKTE